MGDDERRRRRLTDQAHRPGGAWGTELHPYLRGEVPTWFRRAEAAPDRIRTPEDAWVAVEAHAWDALEVMSLWRPRIAESAWGFLKMQFLRSDALRAFLARDDFQMETQAAVLEEVVRGFGNRLFRAMLRMPIERVDEGSTRSFSTARLRRIFRSDQEIRRFFSDKGYGEHPYSEEGHSLFDSLEPGIQWREFMAAQCKQAASRPRYPLRMFAERMDRLLEHLPVKVRDKMIASLELDFRIVRPLGPPDGRSERVAALVNDRLKAPRRLRRRSGAAPTSDPGRATLLPKEKTV